LPEFTTVQKIFIWLIPILLAITLHEAAHGFVAYRLGDDTAKKAGRITLNPFKHVDLVGTIILPVVLFMTTSFIFGWAKPVPVVAEKLRSPKRDMALVALAGPLSNFIMALLWMAAVKLGISLAQHDIYAGFPLLYMGKSGVMINLILMVLNLFPIPPLDGSRVLAFLLPTPWDRRFNQLHPLIGFMIILLLISTGILSTVMTPPLTWLQEMLVTVFALKPS
jgi:Zn-dependent protease